MAPNENLPGYPLLWKHVACMHPSLEELAPLNVEPDTQMMELEAIQQVPIRLQPSLRPAILEFLRAYVRAEYGSRLDVACTIHVCLENVHPCWRQSGNHDRVNVALGAGTLDRALKIRGKRFVIQKQESDDKPFAEGNNAFVEDLTPITHREVG
jgi:hypothetical protein